MNDVFNVGDRVRVTPLGDVMACSMEGEVIGAAVDFQFETAIRWEYVIMFDNGISETFRSEYNNVTIERVFDD